MTCVPLLSDDAADRLLALVAGAGAGAREEVPVGAVIRDAWGRHLAEAGNQPVTRKDPSAHAEMRAMILAAGRIGSERLVGCRLTVSLEPCPMCRAAMDTARVAQVSYDAPRPGGYGSTGCKSDENLEEEVREVPPGGRVLRIFFEKRRGD